MKTPKRPISKEARDHLHNKLERMNGIEKKKTIKRLEMYDNGFRTNHKDWKAGKE